MDHYKSVHPVKYYQDYLEHNIRPDGRELDSFRPIAINLSSINTAQGSAVVRIGNTCVICGIKAELGTPRAEEPDKGFLLVNVELPPLCSSDFKPGPPDDRAQTITAFINNVVANSNIMDVKDLCIAADKMAWVLYCDIVCFSYDGSITDACFMSLVSALYSVKLPKVEYNTETSEITVHDEDSMLSKLNILCQPVCTTFSVFNNDIILSDPCNEEESLSSSLIHIITDGDKLFAVHIPGGVPLTEVQVQDCISKAKVRSLFVKQLMSSIINKNT